MSLASLEAFLARALEEPELQRSLAEAADPAAVAAIARAAGFKVSEHDLWQATAASPADLHAAPLPAAPLSNAPLPDPWLSETPLSAFVHQAQGDEQLQQALAGAPDAAAVASIAQAAGYPISEVDLWLASGTTPDELTASLRPLADGGSVEALPRDAAFQRDEGLSAGDGPSDVDTRRASHGSAEAIPFAAEGPPVGEASLIDEGVWGENDLQAAPAVSADDISPRASAEDAIRQLLGQAKADEALRQALACAPDGAAVAAIAQAAGYPISELALWLASGAAFEEAQPEPEPSSLEDDPLTLFLRAVEVDPDLQIALASAPDAATVAAIARIAGFPLTAADLWAASDAVPQELELQELIFADLAADELLIVMDRDGA